MACLRGAGTRIASLTWVGVAVVVPCPNGGRPLSGGRPAQAGIPETSPAGPPGGHTADPLRPVANGSEMGLGFSQVVFQAPPTSPVFHVNWWDLLAFGEFGAAYFAVAGWVSERVNWAGRRPSSSPCDRINSSLARNSPVGSAVILSSVGEGPRTMHTHECRIIRRSSAYRY